MNSGGPGASGVEYVIGSGEFAATACLPDSTKDTLVYRTWNASYGTDCTAGQECPLGSDQTTAQNTLKAIIVSPDSRKPASADERELDAATLGTSESNSVTVYTATVCLDSNFPSDSASTVDHYCVDGSAPATDPNCRS